MIRNRLIFGFLAPATAVYGVFFLAPTLFTFYYSLFEWSGFGEDKTFVGLGNYARLMNDYVFWLSFMNTITILIVGGIFIMGLAFLYTILINSGIWGKKFFRLVFFLPNIISVVALSAMWAYIYNPRIGLLNSFFGAIGLDGMSKTLWTSPDNIFWAMLAALIWVFTGFFLILIMAGVDKIPADMYEAADLAGANLWQKFRHITVPMTWDVLTISFVIWVINAIKMFEFPFAFGLLQVPQQIYTLGIYLYVMGFGKREPIYQLGYATAIGVVMLVLAFAMIVLVRRLMRRDSLEF
ncbi:carbohydrate ABC transporter permease [uncultured Nitratireductor sp.]|uniref:carbohydrate ABC transporter permease n=1 Tax=uncultured Nitratireductor sp. TaxID=520953 RepID=UPI002637C046|nr:sugar ABC transporter permease [uncultured Nitratireductor sp.]